MPKERLFTLPSLLLSLACGTNDNTVASRSGSGATGGTDSAGGNGAAGASGGSDAGRGGVCQGGSSDSGGAAATGGSAGDGGGGAATGGSAGEDGGGAGTGGTSEGGASSGGGGAGGNGAVGGAGGGASGAGGDWAAPCNDNLDCQVRPASCCGMCGVATRDDVIALNREQGEPYQQEICGNVACPPCAGQPDPTLMASCIGGFCTVVDLLTHEVTACSSAADCRIRASACCECGADLGPGSLIAINPNSPTRYGELACNVDSVCAGCIPQYPATPIDCIDNHCRVVPE